MFKKLKQKLEEGGDGGLERVSFSEKLPGSIVRTTSVDKGSPNGGLLNGSQGIQTSTYLEETPEDQRGELLEPPQRLSSSLGNSQPSSDSENVECEDSLHWHIRETVRVVFCDTTTKYELTSTHHTVTLED